MNERVHAAAKKAGRPASEITLVAVGKTRPLGDLLDAYQAGARHFGENRVQEAEEKLPSLPADAVRHLIGPLQSNKANRAARIAHVIQTIDSVELAGRLSRAAEGEGKTLDVFLEVNVGGEATKAGVAPHALATLAAGVRALPHLRLRGLMGIPPPGDTRPHFVALRELAAQEGLTELSMGMSDDFEIAIEEGATLVRVGSAIFGAR
ncbi:MAG: YggS family pyridoxal phosphate-dependent enzyme [Thermoanaerobaculia bacterium]